MTRELSTPLTHSRYFLYVLFKQKLCMRFFTCRL